VGLDAQVPAQARGLEPDAPGLPEDDAGCPRAAAATYTSGSASPSATTK
jgi:hypothetical protein